MNPVNMLLGGLLDRWLIADDLAGIMFVKENYLTIAGYDIMLPVVISTNVELIAPKTDLPGAQASVVQPMGMSSYDLTVTGITGYFRAKTIPPLPDLPGGAGAAFGDIAGTISTLAGTDELTRAEDDLRELDGILKKVAAGAGAVTIADKQGLLAEIGITHGFPYRMGISNLTAREVPWTIPFYAGDLISPIEAIYRTEEESEA